MTPRVFAAAWAVLAAAACGNAAQSYPNTEYYEGAGPPDGAGRDASPGQDAGSTVPSDAAANADEGVDSADEPDATGDERSHDEASTMRDARDEDRTPGEASAPRVSCGSYACPTAGPVTIYYYPKGGNDSCAGSAPVVDCPPGTPCDVYEVGSGIIYKGVCQ